MISFGLRPVGQSPFFQIGGWCLKQTGRRLAAGFGLHVFVLRALISSSMSAWPEPVSAASDPMSAVSESPFLFCVTPAVMPLALPAGSPFRQSF